MRIIKFRAWDTEDCTMHYGLDLENGDMGYFPEAKIDLCDEHVGVKKPVLMQFTGLLDKNGKEIYEGDIVEPIEKGYGSSPFIVEMMQGYWSIAMFKTNTALVVVGNVYENPELIK